MSLPVPATVLNWRDMMGGQDIRGGACTGGGACCFQFSFHLFRHCIQWVVTNGGGGGGCNLPHNETGKLLKQV